MGIGDWVLIVLAALMAVPFLVLAVEAIASIVPGGRDLPGATARPRCAVLMPAHDEETVITAAIRNVRDQLAPGDRFIVVADNCTDATAVVARAAGIEVAERTDPDRRGKGFALD